VAACFWITNSNRFALAARFFPPSGSAVFLKSRLRRYSASCSRALGFFFVGIRPHSIRNVTGVTTITRIAHQSCNDPFYMKGHLVLSLAICALAAQTRRADAQSKLRVSGGEVTRSTAGRVDASRLANRIPGLEGDQPGRVRVGGDS